MNKSYCKFVNFRENFIFANSVKRQNCDVKKSRLWHDFPSSVNDRITWPFHEDLIWKVTPTPVARFGIKVHLILFLQCTCMQNIHNLEIEEVPVSSIGENVMKVVLM